MDNSTAKLKGAIRDIHIVKASESALYKFSMTNKRLCIYDEETKVKKDGGIMTIAS